MTLTEFLFPQRNYSTIKSRMSGRYQLKDATQPGVDVKTLPPKRFIGKGYGDKGTLKNCALDGSPSWQEVSSSEKYEIEVLLDELEREGDLLTFQEKREKQKRVLELLKLPGIE